MTLWYLTAPSSAAMKPSRDIARLIEIMAALRTPGSGCPWDLEQNFSTIAPYTLEEAYEVADAIARGDLDDLREELGDLLLQVVFHARMAEEQRAFDFGDVVAAITTKLVRRHPHVFGDAKGLNPKAVERLWQHIKAQEKQEKNEKQKKTARSRRKSKRNSQPSVLAGVPVGMPALTRALKLQQKAGRVGFDWNDAKAVLAKIREEADEIAVEIASGDQEKAAAEVGDLLFAVVNLARHLDVDPEAAVRATNIKFERRFAAIEHALAKQGKQPQGSSLAEMDALWNAAKAAEKTARPVPLKAAAKTASRQTKRRSRPAKRRAVRGSR
jgi:ATP diphosphatase